MPRNYCSGLSSSAIGYGYMNILLFFTFALFPFMHGILQFEIGIITFNPFILCLILLFFISLFTIIKGYKYNFSMVEILLYLLCLLYLSSTLFSETLIKSGYLAFHAFFVPILTFYVLKANINSFRNYNYVIYGLSLGVTVFAIIGFYKYMQQPHRIELFGEQSIGICTFTIVPIVYSFIYKWYKQVIGTFVLLCSIILFIITFSRVYLIILIISPLFYFIIKNGKSFILINLFFIFSFLFTIFMVIYVANYNVVKPTRKPDAIYARITDFDFWKYAFNWRAKSYKEGLHNFLNKPLLGNGLKSNKYTTTRHNFHIEWLEYGGILGWLIYIFVFIFHFYKSSKFTSEDPVISANLLLLFMIMCNSLTNGFMHGMGPYVSYMVLGLNEAKYKMHQVLT